VRAARGATADTGNNDDDDDDTNFANCFQSPPLTRAASSCCLTAAPALNYNASLRLPPRTTTPISRFTTSRSMRRPLTQGVETRAANVVVVLNEFSYNGRSAYTRQYASVGAHCQRPLLQLPRKRRTPLVPLVIPPYGSLGGYLVYCAFLFVFFLYGYGLLTCGKR